MLGSSAMAPRASSILAARLLSRMTSNSSISRSRSSSSTFAARAVPCWVSMNSTSGATILSCRSLTFARAASRTVCSSEMSPLARNRAVCGSGSVS